MKPVGTRENGKQGPMSVKAANRFLKMIGPEPFTADQLKALLEKKGYKSTSRYHHTIINDLKGKRMIRCISGTADVQVYQVTPLYKQRT